MHTEILRGNFVVLRAGALQLLLPQEEVGAAEHIDLAVHPTARPGVFAQGEGSDSREVVAPSEHLRSLETFPADRFVLTRLGRHPVQFAWNEVRVLIDAELEVQPLPDVMQMKDGLIDGFVAFDGTLALCTTADRVVSFMALGEG
jgi:hypothetical protein